MEKNDLKTNPGKESVSDESDLLVTDTGAATTIAVRDAPVIRLDSAVLEAFTCAKGKERTIFLKTNFGQRISEPLLQLIKDTESYWFVKLPGGATSRDALTMDPSRNIAATSGNRIRTEPVESSESPEALQLVVSWSFRASARSGIFIGGNIETFISGLCGCTPESWGVCEPPENTWNKAAMNKFIQSKMPKPSKVIVSADQSCNAIFTMLVQRTEYGIEEQVTGIVDIGAPGSDEAQEKLARVCEVLSKMCTDTMPLFGAVFSRLGRKDLTHEPQNFKPINPIALLIGPPGVRELKLDLADMKTRFGAVIAGRGKMPAVIFDLQDTPKDETKTGIEHLIKILDTLNPDIVNKIINPKLLNAWQQNEAQNV